MWKTRWNLKPGKIRIQWKPGSTGSEAAFTYQQKHIPFLKTWSVQSALMPREQGNTLSRGRVTFLVNGLEALLQDKASRAFPCQQSELSVAHTMRRETQLYLPGFQREGGSVVSAQMLTAALVGGSELQQLSLAHSRGGSYGNPCDKSHCWGQPLSQQAVTSYCNNQSTPSASSPKSSSNLGQQNYSHNWNAAWHMFI